MGDLYDLADLDRFQVGLLLHGRGSLQRVDMRLSGPESAARLEATDRARRLWRRSRQAFFTAGLGLTLLTSATSSSLEEEVASLDNKVNSLAVVEVHAHLLDEASDPASVKPKLTATPVSESEDTKSVTVDLEIGVVASLSLERSTKWRLETTADGFWSKDVLVDPSIESTVDFFLIATGEIAIRTEADAMDEPPDSLQVRFVEPGELAKSSERIEGGVVCPLKKREIVCRLPATSLDLKVHGSGIMPIYLWSVAVKPLARTSAGTARLERGASLSGWVRWPRTLERSDSVRVNLQPFELDSETSLLAEKRRRLLVLNSTVTQEGFFQIRGAPPGRYSLAAEAAGFASQPIESVVMEPGGEVVLDRDVILLPLSDLEIWVEPPFGPEGLPWTLLLFRESKWKSGVRRSVAEGKTDLSGSWVYAGLVSGKYEIELRDEAGKNAWLKRTIEVNSDTPPLFLEAEIVEIEGRVALGGDPLEAELWFGGRFGEIKVPISSDEEGYFHGYLPHEGSWPIDLHEKRANQFTALREVEVARMDGHRAARVEIELPNTLLGVRVMDEEGQPVSGAAVAVRPQNTDDLYPSAYLVTNQEGEVEFVAVAPGEALVQARDSADSDYYSDQVAVTIAEESEIRLELVIRQEKQVAIAVHALGQPLADAMVFAISDNGATRRQSTDPAGRASFSLPTGNATALVAASGFATRLFGFDTSALAEAGVVIEMRTSGGVLHFTMPDLEPGEGPADPLILRHNGSAISFVQLVSLLGPRIDMEARLISFSAFEPGEYRLCLGSSASCGGGLLVEGGELTVDIAEVLPPQRSLLEKQQESP